MPRFGLRLLLTAVLVGPPASAVEFPVTRMDDPEPPGVCGVGDCSLREAILAANALVGPDLITLPPGAYNVNGPGAYEDAAAFGDLDVTDDLTILGAGADSTTIQVIATFVGPIKVFHIDPARTDILVEIADVTIASPFDLRPLPDLARCVLNDGSLLLNRVIVRDCNDGGPAIYNDFSASMTVFESTVRDNTTITHGGAASRATARSR